MKNQTSTALNLYMRLLSVAGTASLNPSLILHNLYPGFSIAHYFWDPESLVANLIWSYALRDWRNHTLGLSVHSVRVGFGEAISLETLQRSPHAEDFYFLAAEDGASAPIQSFLLNSTSFAGKKPDKNEVMKEPDWNAAHTIIRQENNRTALSEALSFLDEVLVGPGAPTLGELQAPLSRMPRGWLIQAGAVVQDLGIKTDLFSEKHLATLN